MTAPALTLRAASAALALLLTACDRPAYPPQADGIAPPPEAAARDAPTATSGPRHFASVLELFEDLNDFPPETNMLAVVAPESASQPLRLRISPDVAPGERPEIVRELVQRALVYAVLRVFLHTDTQAVHVTAQPIVIDLKRSPASGQTRLLPAPLATVTATRAQVEKLVKDMTGADLPAMIGREIIGGHFDPDTWSELGLRLNYNDQGPPGLAAFGDALGIEWHDRPQPKGKKP